MRERERGSDIYIQVSLDGRGLPRGYNKFWLSCVCGNVPTDGNQAHPKSDDFRFKLHLTADNDFMATLTRFNVVVVVSFFGCWDQQFVSVVINLPERKKKGE